MTSWLHLSNRAPKPRRLKTRIAMSAAVAAVAAGGFVALGPSLTATAGHAPSPASHSVGAVPADSPLTNVSTVAYTLSPAAGDAVTVTLRAGADRKTDAAQLQKDLAALGVQAHVRRGWAHTYPAIVSLAHRNNNGDYVATVYRKAVTKYPQTIVFSLTTSDADALSITQSGN